MPDSQALPPSPQADTRPEWSRTPFYEFFGYLDTESQLISLAATGISSLVGAESVAEAIHGVADLLDLTEDETKSRLDRARVQADLARAELEADFPLLHAHSLVGVWGALESLVRDVVRAWLTNRRELLETGDFGAVRIPVAAFQRMRVSQRIDYLIDQVPAQPGIAGGFPRFEALLSKVGLDGPVEDSLRRKLIEVHQVRNLYAHRGGVVDHHAKQTCPWRREWKLGTEVKVDHETWESYIGAIHEYVFLLIRRSAAKFDFDVDAHLEWQEALRAQGAHVTHEDGFVTITPPTTDPDESPE